MAPENGPWKKGKGRPVQSRASREQRPQKADDRRGRREAASHERDGQGAGDARPPGQAKPRGWKHKKRPKAQKGQPGPGGGVQEHLTAKALGEMIARAVTKAVVAEAETRWGPRPPQSATRTDTGPTSKAPTQPATPEQGVATKVTRAPRGRAPGQEPAVQTGPGAEAAPATGAALAQPPGTTARKRAPSIPSGKTSRADTAETCETDSATEDGEASGQSGGSESPPRLRASWVQAAKAGARRRSRSSGPHPGRAPGRMSLPPARRQ